MFELKDNSEHRKAFHSVPVRKAIENLQAVVLFLANSHITQSTCSFHPLGEVLLVIELIAVDHTCTATVTCWQTMSEIYMRKAAI